MIIFTFDSTHIAIAAENLCANIEGTRLIPLPPSISAGCGLSLKINDDSLSSVKTMLDSKGLIYSSIYSYNSGEYTKL